MEQLVDNVSFYFVFPVLCLALLCIFYRLFTGPSLLDKVIALDLLITTGVGFIATFSMVYDKVAFVDVIVILAVLAFLSTVAFAYYFENRLRQDPEGDDDCKYVKEHDKEGKSVSLKKSGDK